MCPECGAPKGRVVDTGSSENEGWPLRSRRCGICEHLYATIEVPISEATFHELAVNRRDQKRERARKARGFHDMKCGRYKRSRKFLEIVLRVLQTTRSQPKLLEESTQKP